jgi:hypothetical protein
MALWMWRTVIGESPTPAREIKSTFTNLNFYHVPYYGWGCWYRIDTTPAQDGPYRPGGIDIFFCTFDAAPFELVDVGFVRAGLRCLLSNTTDEHDYTAVEERLIENDCPDLRICRYRAGGDRPPGSLPPETGESAGNRTPDLSAYSGPVSADRAKVW